MIINDLLLLATHGIWTAPPREAAASALKSSVDIAARAVSQSSAFRTGSRGETCGQMRLSSVVLLNERVALVGALDCKR